jgi:hypothetical protein
MSSTRFTGGGVKTALALVDATYETFFGTLNLFF